MVYEEGSEGFAEDGEARVELRGGEWAEIGAVGGNLAGQFW